MTGRDLPAADAVGELTRALYAAISGPAGVPRDWETHRRQFADGAVITVVHRRDDGGATFERLSVETYRATREPYFAANGFYEIELSREVSVAGGLAHVFSRYAAYRALGAEPFDGGVNSLQLVRDGAAWRIVSILWEAGAAAAEVRRLAASREG